MNRKALSVCAAAVAAVVTPHLHAAEIQWKGGAGALISSNYTIDGLDTRTPVSGDILNLGANGVVGSATSTSLPGRIRVGHAFPDYAAAIPGTPNAFTGPAELNVTGGTLTLGGQETGGLFVGVRGAGLVLGYNNNGTVNVSGGTVNVSQRIIVGVDDPNDTVTSTATGTLNVSGTGTVRSQNNDMLVGNGNAGAVSVSDTGSLFVLPTSLTQANTPSLTIGVSVPSTYTQTSGSLSVANNFLIGSGSTVGISGGTVTTKAQTTAAGYTVQAAAGNIAVGRNGSSNDVLNISNDAQVNIGWRFLLGSGGAGGVNSVVNQTGGTVNVGLNLAVGDTGNNTTATYNLSGGSLTFNSEYSRVGRRGDGKFFHTGGNATFNTGLSVGDDESTGVGETDNATGLYQISGGTVVAGPGPAAADALRVGFAGNGTFRVVGDDGVVDVNGNMLVGNTADGVGNLTYRFEGGDGLSQIDVSGNATLASGTGLSLDWLLADPTQTSYDLLTATDIIDNGVSMATPGWTLSVVPGGNGEILRASQDVVGATLYWDTDGATPGSGGATPSGNWDGATANFSSDAAGTSASTTALTSGSAAVVFSAGSDATGSYTVNVNGARAASSVAVTGGNVTFTGGSIATPAVDVAAGATATVNSAVSSTAGLTKSGAGTLTLTSANTYTGGTTVAAGTLVAGNADAINAGQALTVNDGATLRSQAGVSTALDVASLSIAATGRVDVNDGGIVKRNGGSGTAGQAATQAISAALKTGLENGGNFDWLGAGISSTEANADNALAGSVLYGVGVIQNNLAAAGTADGTTTDETPGNTIYTSFKGRDVVLNDTLVRYTYMGDADLDGSITGTDYSLIDAGFAASLAGWLNGDFDYSGAIDGTDYALIDNAFASQVGPLSDEFLALYDQHVAMFGQEYVGALAAVQAGVVPEPGTLGVLALAGVGLAARRRRRA